MRGRLWRPSLLGAVVMVSAAAGLVVGAAGCPGVLDDPDRFRGDFCSDIETELFPQKCSSGDCHDAIEPEAMLDLQSPGVAARLVGITGQGEECFMQGTLVIAGNAEGSLLYQKLNDTQPCGARMPFIGDALTEQEIGCVATWIEALDDEPVIDAAGAPDASASASDATP